MGDISEFEEFNMDDLENDKELQNELRMLGWSDDHAISAAVNSHRPEKSNKKEQRERSSTNVADSKKVDHATIATVKVEEHANYSRHEMTNDDGENVEFTEEDMNDPDLLAEFRELHGDGDEDNDERNYSHLYTNESQTRKDPKNDKHTNNTPVPVVTQSWADSNLGIISVGSTNIHTSSVEIITADEAISKALYLSKEGNKTEAVKWLKISKLIEKGISYEEAFESVMMLSTSASTAPRQQSPHSIPAVKATSSQKINTTASKKPIPTDAFNSVGRTTSAMSVTPTSSSSSSQGSRFALLESALAFAMKEALKEAKHLQATDRKAAAEKMREYKRFDQEMNVLFSRRGIPGAEPAPFSWQTIEKNLVIEHLDIGDDQLVLMVEGIFDLEVSLAGHSSRTVVLSYDLGLPREEPITGKMTGTVGADNCVILDFKRIIPVIKRGRSIQALVARKKCTFEITLTRGMFYSPISLGTASLALSGLNEKCEIGGVLTIEKTSKDPHFGTGKKGKENNSSPGSVRVLLRVRKPLAGPEVIRSEERTLVLETWPSVSHIYRDQSPIIVPVTVDSLCDEFDGASSPEEIPSTSPSTLPAIILPSSPAAPVKPAKPAKPSSSTKPIDAPHGHTIPINTTTPQPIQSQEKQVSVTILTEGEKNDPCGVAYLESNDVLEAEIEDAEVALKVINSKPANARTEEDDDALFSLNLRMQLLGTKMQILISNVQNEKLSIVIYLEMVTERLARDRVLLQWIIQQLALKDPPEGFLENKKALIKRIGIMDREIRSAQDAMEEN